MRSFKYAPLIAVPSITKIISACSPWSPGPTTMILHHIKPIKKAKNVSANYLAKYYDILHITSWSCIHRLSMSTALNRSPKKLYWLQGLQFVTLDVLGSQPSRPGLAQIWRPCSLQEIQTQDTTNETISFPRGRPTLHIWCKARVPVTRITYFLVLMFLANQCVDLYLHSHMSRRGDEVLGQILQYLRLTTNTSRTNKNSGFKRFYSTFTSISFKTTCLQNMSDFAENFLVSIRLIKLII